MKKILLLLVSSYVLIGCYHTPQIISSHEVARTLEKNKHRLQAETDSEITPNGSKVFVLKYNYGLIEDVEVGAYYADFDDLSIYRYLVGLRGKYAFMNQKEGLSVALSGDLGFFVFNSELFKEGDQEELSDLYNKYPKSITGTLIASYKKERLEPYASVSYRFLECGNKATDGAAITTYENCFAVSVLKTDTYVTEWYDFLYASAGIKLWVLPERLSVNLEISKVLSKETSEETDEKGSTKTVVNENLIIPSGSVSYYF